MDVISKHRRYSRICVNYGSIRLKNCNDVESIVEQQPVKLGGKLRILRWFRSFHNLANLFTPNPDSAIPRQFARLFSLLSYASPFRTTVPTRGTHPVSQGASSDTCAHTRPLRWQHCISD